MSEVWATGSQATSRTIDTHVRLLTAKLDPAFKWINTVRGVGYRINSPK